MNHNSNENTNRDNYTPTQSKNSKESKAIDKSLSKFGAYLEFLQMIQNMAKRGCEQ